MTSGRQQENPPTASTPAQHRNMFHRYQLRTKNHSENMFYVDVQATQKTTAKNDSLTPLKAQKKPAVKISLSRHIKKAQKISKSHVLTGINPQEKTEV